MSRVFFSNQNLWSDLNTHVVIC